jgi:hypothetical protein
MFFVGENPPTDAVIQYHLNEPVDELSIRISDASGKTIRELSAPESRRQPGIRTVCWDQRHQPIERPPSPDRSGETPSAAARGGAGRARAEIPGVPAPLAPAGYLPADPCSGGGGGGGTTGPYVTPGTYQVSLVVDGNTVGTKPMSIVMDAEVDLSGVDRLVYDEMLLSLHELERRGTEAAGHLNLLHADLEAVADTIGDMDDVPDDVKADFTEFREAFDEVRVKFGVPMSGGGGRSFGRGGGGGSPANVLGRTSTLKSTIMSIWEVPSDALVDQYYEVSPLLDAAIGEAQESLEQARLLAAKLERYDLTLTLPPFEG